MYKILRSFARQVKSKQSFTEKLEEFKENKPFVRNLQKASKSQSLTVITKEWLAKRHIGITTLPEKFLRGLRNLYGKYRDKDIREWGYDVAEGLTKIHGLEKPMDISKIKLFATTPEVISGNYIGTQKKYSFLIQKQQIKQLGTDEIIQISQTPLQQEPSTKKSLQYSFEQAIGYSYKRSPSTYGSVYRSISEIKFRQPTYNIQKALDFGAGTGASSFAIEEVFPQVQIINAIEPSTNMQQIGKKATRFSDKIHWNDSLAALPSIATEQGKYDLVVCSYVIGEIENPSTRNLIVDAMWHRSNAFVVFIEPGTPKGFRLIHSIREWFRQNIPLTEAGILAPCPHEGNCPLAKQKSWCHFSQFAERVPKDIVGKLPNTEMRDNEKFSYIILQKFPTPRQTVQHENMTESLSEQSYFWGRAVRPGIKRTKHVYLDLCETNMHQYEGENYPELRRFGVTRFSYGRQAYRYARDINWGDLWPNYERINKKR